MRSRGKQGVGKERADTGQGQRARRRERGMVLQRPPCLCPAALQPGLGAEKPRAPHLPLLLASSESRSLNYG